MDILTVLIVLVVVGVCLYLVENYIPLSPPIQVVIRVVVVLLLVIWLLQLVLGSGTVRLPRLGG